MLETRKIKINNLQEIETEQLIQDIEQSKDFHIYEISDSDQNTEILVKIINKRKMIF